MADFPVAVHAFAGAACIGGALDAHMVAAMTIYEQKKIHMIRLIQENHQGHYGAIGISLVSRHTGVVEEHSIQNITVRDS